MVYLHCNNFARRVAGGRCQITRRRSYILLAVFGNRVFSKNALSENCSVLGTDNVRSFTLRANDRAYNPSIICARARLVQTRHLGKYSLAKTGEYPRLLKTGSLHNAIQGI